MYSLSIEEKTEVYTMTKIEELARIQEILEKVPKKEIARKTGLSRSTVIAYARHEKKLDLMQARTRTKLIEAFADNPALLSEHVDYLRSARSAYQYVLAYTEPSDPLRSQAEAVFMAIAKREKELSKA